MRAAVGANIGSVRAAVGVETGATDWRFVRRSRRRARRWSGGGMLRARRSRVVSLIVCFFLKPWLHPPFALPQCPIESKTERFERPTKTTFSRFSTTFSIFYQPWI